VGKPSALAGGGPRGKIKGSKAHSDKIFAEFEKREKDTGKGERGNIQLYQRAMSEKGAKGGGKKEKN